ncbi:MAG: S41 family peptidase [SAR324 cluster bacterium]|nr:S41 family peptidase [SAR324 cluster bacterium]
MSPVYGPLAPVDRPRDSSSMVSEVLMRIQLDYANPEKKGMATLLEGVLRELERHFFELRTSSKQASSGVSLKLWTTNWKFESSPQPLDDFGDLNRILQTIHSELIRSPQDINPSKLEQILLRGLTQKLDPYTAVLPRELHREFRVSVDGSFAGVGLMVGFRKNQLIVISPMVGSPAARAGILPMDRIIRVDGEETEYLTLDEILFRLRGEKGTQVGLHITREGVSSPIEFILKREEIRVESVDVLDWKQNDFQYRYLRIKNFQDSTAEELKSKLGNAGSVNGLILDLRNNPGGLLEQAVQVSDLFLESGKTIVSTRGRRISSKFQSRRLFRFASWSEVPMVVLVNRGSASASEIVTAALQQNGRALIVGEKTFGKGTVQSLSELKDGSGLKMTIGDYLTPSGEWINETGIMPDVLLQPVIITENRYRLYPLMGNIDPSKPIKLPYLHQEETEEERISKAKNLTPKNLREDYFISVAEEMASLLWQNGLDDGEAIKGKIQSLRKEQQQKIISRLKQQEVNWDLIQADAASSNSHPEMSVSWSSDGTAWTDLPTDKILSPGNSSFLRVRVHNPSSFPMKRLKAEIRSESKALNGLELPLGMLLPGKMLIRIFNLSISPGSLASLEPFDLVILDHMQQERARLNTHLQFNSHPGPRFSFYAEEHDDGSWESQGNGDGIADPGETHAIRIRLHNYGSHVSGKTLLRLTRTSGQVRIPRGRVQLGLLKSGEKLEDTLLIQIPEELEAKGHLKLEIRDQDSSFPGLIYNWSLDRPLPSHDLQGPLMQSFTLLRDKNPSMQHKFMLKGKILDQMGLKDMQVFVNGQKIEYRLFNQEFQRHKVEVSIPLTLEKSRNRIEIHARDSDGILSQRILNWWKWVEKEAVSFNGNS